MSDFYKRAVYVSGLPSSIQYEDLTEIFASLSGVEHIFILKDDVSGLATGRAFVIFREAKSVAIAIREKNDTTPHADHVLKVATAKSDMEVDLASLVRAKTRASSQEEELANIVRQLQAMDPEILKRVLGQVSTKPDTTKSQLTPVVDTTASATVKTEPPSPSPSMFPFPVEDTTFYSLKIPLFSGDGGKGEVTFPQWKYEIRCLRNAGKPAKAIQQAVRRSLRGNAAEVLRYMGEKVGLDQILDKFEINFGEVLTPEQLLADFYSAEQVAKQSCTIWGCKLEHILTQLQEKGSFSPAAVQDMLRSKFWMGLQDERIKNATRHKFESGSTYEDLLTSVRKLELEFAPKAGAAKQQAQQATPSDPLMDKMDKLLSEMSDTRQSLKSMDTRIAKLEQPDRSGSSKTDSSGGKSSNATNKPKVTCTRCSRRGHAVEKCHATFHRNGQALNQ